MHTALQVEYIRDAIYIRTPVSWQKVTWHN